MNLARFNYNILNNFFNFYFNKLVFFKANQNLFLFFLYTHKPCPDSTKICINLHKNLHKFYKILKKFRKFAITKKKISYFNNRFTRLSWTSQLNSNLSLFKQTPHFKFSYVTHFFFLSYKKTINKDWSYLIGSLIPSFFWNFNKKNYIAKTDLELNFFLKSWKESTPKLRIKNYNFFIKKKFINNFFYLNKLRIDYKNLKYLVNTNSSADRITSDDWYLTKPYLFLNLPLDFFTKNPINFNGPIYDVFKNFVRIYVSLKKTRRFPRTKLSLNFKKYSFKSSLYFLHQNRPQNLRRINFFSKKKNRKFFSRKIEKTHCYYYRTFYNNFLLRSSRFPGSKNLFFYFAKIKNKNNKFLIRKKFYILYFKKSIKKFNLKKKFIKIKKFFIFNNLNLFLLKKRKSLFSSFKPVKLLNKKNKQVLFYPKYRTFQKIIHVFNVFYFWKKFISFSTSDSSFVKTANFLQTDSLTYNESNIFRILHKASFFTKDKTAFLFSMDAFFLVCESVSCERNFDPSSELKKTLYSFSYKNEMQRYILKKYFKNKFISIFSEDKADHFHFLNEKSENTFSPFKNTTAFDPFCSSITFVSFLLNSSLPTNQWPHFKNRIDYRFNLDESPSDFAIKRIRFKPGYMSQWRDAREILKSSLGLKYRYQYRFTRYISRFNKFIKFKTYLLLEMQLLNILIRSRLITDNLLLDLFIENNLVYVNGAICNNPTFQIFVNDIVQFIVTFKYYILHKWFANWILKRKNKLKKIIKRKAIAGQALDEKQKSNIIPKWVLYNKNLIEDVPKFLELDYFTLSAFVVYEPFSWIDLNYYNIFSVRFSVINMYNWKYIT